MSQHRDLTHPRDALLKAMERIYRYRMTTTSGGNLSIKDDEGDVWITPARLDKGSLRRDDIVRVRRDGTIEGRHKPSSELPFHQAIYQARPDVRGIVHAHPVALVAFSICRQVPDTSALHQARKICGKVGFALYALPGSAELGTNIARTFEQGYDCVILENHGVVVAGPGLQSAFERFETLEFAAKTIIKGSILGPIRSLSDADADRIGPPPASAQPFEPGPASTLETELRRQLCEFVHRAYQQRLMISTQGAFSARLGADSFLITPHRVDRSLVSVEDLVLVENGSAENGKQPSGSARNHRGIYRKHPEIQSIVNAYPVNATAFGLTATPLDSRTIPESYLFLRDINRVPYGVQFAEADEIAQSASPRQPILILDNDGVQVWGTSILDAFDRLEVLETTAEAMINSKPLGAMVPMSDQAIRELNRHFDLT
jgi:L-fuculose-phosphate aldolase